MTRQIRIGDRITSISGPKVRDPDPVFKEIKTEQSKSDNWILDVLNPLSPLSPFNNHGFYNDWLS